MRKDQRDGSTEPRIFWGSYARNLWRKSLLRCCFARNLFNYLESKILKENPDQNALEYLALWEGVCFGRLPLTYLFDKYKYHILIFSTAGPVLNSNLQLYLDMKFFFAISVIEFPVLLGILRPTILASLFFDSRILKQRIFQCCLYLFYRMLYVCAFQLNKQFK